ncbi:MAG: ABC transporter ATP-binding protein [Bacteroidales bacterium]|nr:ABC transporter ATP-binding protein [Bacteroidales bacterium]
MLIDIKNIEKEYMLGNVNVKALRGIDLEIKENEYLAIMGPSGSGKSTLMNILGCLDTPSSGKYLFDNVDVKSLNDDELSMIRNKKIGFIFQTFNLLPKANAIHNVELPLIYAGIDKHKRKLLAEEALHKVGLENRMHHKPGEMSGGQRQRVAIARALVNKPEIILADEPTGNLDSKTGEEIMEIFSKLNNDGNTVILITHERAIAEHSKRIIQLFDGKITSDVKITD